MGAVEPDVKHGPKFRAPYSGYGLALGAGLIPIKRVSILRDLAAA